MSVATTVDPQADDHGDELTTVSATLGGDIQSRKEQITFALFIVVPFLAVAAAVPVAWGGWLGLERRRPLLLHVLPHRARHHRRLPPALHAQGLQAQPAVKIFLAIAGSMAVQGPVVRWVADHRKHHKFSDRDGDPHSPWRYGSSIGGLTKGLFHAHMMWIFNPEQTPQRKYAPDLMKDRDVVRISRQFPMWVVVSLAAPAVLGGLLTMSWQGARHRRSSGRPWCASPCCTT